MTGGKGILLGLVLVATACAPATAPDRPLEPLVWGAEQHLTVQWQPAGSEQAAVVWGYVANQSPYTFDRLRLLVEGLGPGGEILMQRLVWSPGLLGSWGRNYFEAPMAPAPAYRVRVFSYDRVEFDGWRRRGPFW